MSPAAIIQDRLRRITAVLQCLKRDVMQSSEMSHIYGFLDEVRSESVGRMVNEFDIRQIIELSTVF